MELNWAQLTLFLYIIARMSGFVLFNPLLGRKSLPGLFRAGLILSLSVFVFPLAQQQTTLPDGVIALALRLLLELALGFVLGMVINFFFYIPQLAGLVIDTQMGMTMNEIYDAGAQANMSVTGQFLNVLMTLLFFAANGHHTLLRIMASSGQIVPFGAVSFGPELSSAMLSLFVECTVLAVKLCMPILAAELLGQIGMGILMKAIPQINVFSINIELKVLIGLALLFILIAPFSEFLLDAEMMMLDSLEAVLKLTG
ncbi:flagellar biosynthetic protein FliR [Intestinimonas sp.]|uniref:flagellar biosynthetic protein FliR n=1 Tax=Intestinimonas sp. TaxID=1965293 RepID=UPI0026267B3F|nr:flagellar biosynthetic protein FliR [Intestinimonas sp.]